MAYAFQQVAISAQKNSKSLINPIVARLEPKEIVLLRMLMKNGGSIKPKDIAEAFQVTPRTATNWTKEWLGKGILESASGEKRITSYRIGVIYSNIRLSDLGYLDEKVE
ncbi:hypothetical protein PaeBR_02440 [Paenibacillus sp. BR2-3]|uniref:hypothetical protein n=1 Tax=Paenibacillus sp. BR2-3 TaxID=3048494 RepID=UPI003977950B